MKKLCLTVGLLGVVVVTAFGQGQVSVLNYVGSGNPANAIINDTNGSPTALQGGTFLVDLLYGTSTSSLNQDAGLALTFSSNPAAAGFFNSASLTLNSGFVGTVAFELVVWQASAGASWVAATGGGANPNVATYVANGGTEWGQYVFTLTGLAASPAPPVSTAQGAGTLQPFNLIPVPEPATCALMGLGGLSLLLFRRRK